MNSIRANRQSFVVDQPSKKSVFQGFGPNRSPVILHSRRKAFSELSTKITPRKKSEKGSAQNRLLADGNKCLNSILRTPKSETKRQIQRGEGRHHVTFQQSTPTSGVKKLEQSLLGYDWIAGMLDNDSFISQKDDSFFNELKEFRRVNRSECTGSSILQNETNSPQFKYTPQGFQEGNYNKCSDAYVLDDRLFAVPIHGTNSYCSLCKTRKPAEYENQDSYVRISVPRSTLQSPHRIKPHRRKSFDPTDTVSLSKHCLLGWQSSKPSVIPSQSAMDLRAHTGISKLNSLNWSNSSLKTSEPLRTHSDLLHDHPYETARRKPISQI
ncbi:migration and invasion-inhibitory protein-like [Dendronephthya gigantea]|uniref:migration and invasion-inhibitory protein-like n=1 Tax=Dendronephthya gigantea TaxID=151771 RepID=UPI00106D94F7|nr:migration and invasion-inhibitory protein-like [Dendronephthya gigantea]